MNAEEFRRLGHAFVDWIADYREGVASRPVMSRVQPGEIRARFAAEPPETGGRAHQALDVLARDVMPGITHWSHPAFFAYFPSNTSYASVLGDLLSSGLGVQGMSWQTSPAATEVEEVVMDWLRRMVGLSDAWSGVIHDTASTATLCALLCARERAAGGAPLAMYASAEAHSSVDKAARLAGFARERIHAIATDATYAMRADALRDAVHADLAVGVTPCAIVATVGTTSSTAMDPVAAIADVARECGAWLHVDAAMAGTAMVAPECRALWDGVERVDSLVFNPHKWMGVGFDLTAYFVRDPQQLIRVMGTNPSYLHTAHDGRVTNYRDWQIPLGRRFRALKLWLHLLDVGVEGIRARVRRDLANARWLAGRVDAEPHWERVAPVPLQTVCVRHVPEGLDGAALDRHQLAIATRVNDGGRAYVTPGLLGGRQMIRVSVGAERTEREHVALVWDELRRAADGG